MNRDEKTVTGFGDEWERFDQKDLSKDEHKELFERYFSIFPWDKVTEKSTGFDMGCGSGRWAKLLAPKVGKLHCIDPSSALEIARRNLVKMDNCFFHRNGVDERILPDASQDFGVSLGVLHHIPDTAAGIKSCSQMLKPGAPFLLYLYYALDNRPLWFRLLWQLSDAIRSITSKLPHSSRYIVSQIIAVVVYWPFARASRVLERVGLPESLISLVPLSTYRSLSFYTIRTDALDRFGTRLEQRFTKRQISEMMLNAGLENITFSDSEPYWVAVGYKK